MPYSISAQIIFLLNYKSTMSKFPTLLKLAKKGQTDKLAQIIQEEQVNLNEIDPKTGKGLLHIAIQNEDEDLFQALTRRPGIDFQLSTSDGEFPLEMAVRLNSIFFVTKLLDHNINFRRKNAQGDTVLHIAVRNPTHRQILKKLTTNRFDINEPLEKIGSFLNLAIVSDQSDSFYFFIKELGVQYTKRFDAENNTCLLLAVKHNKGDYVVAILQKLEQDPLITPIDRQFFINHQNNEGNSALHEAAQRNLQTITQKLETVGKNLGIDLSIRNKKGFTVEQIKVNLEKDRLNQIQMEKRRAEERIVRKKQKIEQKVRQKQQEQRQQAEQLRLKKQEEIKLSVENKVKAQTQRKKTLWIFGILFVIALAGMYLALVNAIQKKKPVTL